MFSQYVDGTIDPAVCEDFEKHMAGCNPRQVVVDNIRKTITLYKKGKPYELPAPVPQTAPQRLAPTLEGDTRRAKEREIRTCTGILYWLPGWWRRRCWR